MYVPIPAFLHGITSVLYLPIFRPCHVKRRPLIRFSSHHVFSFQSHDGPHVSRGDWAQVRVWKDALVAPAREVFRGQNMGHRQRTLGHLNHGCRSWRGSRSFPLFCLILLSCPPSDSCWVQLCTCEVPFQVVRIVGSLSAVLVAVLVQRVWFRSAVGDSACVVCRRGTSGHPDARKVGYAGEFIAIKGTAYEGSSSASVRAVRRLGLTQLWWLSPGCGVCQAQVPFPSSPCVHPMSCNPLHVLTRACCSTSVAPNALTFLIIEVILYKSGIGMEAEL